MRFFYDLEFLERGPEFPLELISMGVAAEDGRELFLANSEFDLVRMTPWLREHVLPSLPPVGHPSWRPRAEIAAELQKFVGEETPEWWGDFAAYDHVILCQLFGDMTGLPSGWPMFTRDLEQLKEFLGNPPLPVYNGRPHDALAEACWLRDCWRMLEEERSRRLHFNA